MKKKNPWKDDEMLWKYLYGKVLSSSVDFLPGYADHNVETDTFQQSCFPRALIIMYQAWI